MSITPIVVLAFARKESLKNILSQIDVLKARSILLSFDGIQGANPKYKNNYLSNLEFAEKWANDSKHDVEIITRNSNLGCNSHNREVLLKASKKYSDFFHFEDDVEFRAELIEFVDKQKKQILSNHIWGVCGYNPSVGGDLSKLNFNKEVTFSLHRTWSNFGWWTSSHHIDNYFETLGHLNLRQATEIINMTAQEMRLNPILRIGFSQYWLHKVSRAINSYPDWDSPMLRNLAVSWDAWAVLEVWRSKKLILKPEYSLSREGAFQFEDQEHIHDYPKKSWQEFKDKEIRIACDSHFVHLLKDNGDLSEWGISNFSSFKLLTRYWVKLIIGFIRIPLVFKRPG